MPEPRFPSRSGARRGSPLEAQADERNGRVVVGADDVGAQPFLAHLALDLDGARELVGYPGGHHVAMIDASLAGLTYSSMP